MKIESAKAPRKCNECKSTIKKHERCGVLWTKTFKGNYKKKSFCKKCSIKILSGQIKLMENIVERIKE